MDAKQLIEHLHELTGLKFREVPSSNLYLIAYHENLRILYVVFRNKRKGDPDPEWVYQYKVNPWCYKSFLQAQSMGQFFIENIKEHVLCKSKITY